MNVLIAGLISVVSAQALLFAVARAFVVSQHPTISLLMRLALLIIAVVIIILREKKNVIYLFLVSFPFYRIWFNGISLVTFFAVTLLFIYKVDIWGYMTSRKDIFRFPFFLLSLTVLWSMIISKYPYNAAEQFIFFISLTIIYLCFMANITNSTISIKGIFICLIIVNVLALFVSFWQFCFGINSIKFFLGEYAPNVGLSEYIKRIPGFFFEAQGAGIYYAIMIMLSFAARVFFRKKTCLLILILGNCLALLITGTRIAFLGILIAMAVAQLFTLNFRKSILIGTMLVALILGKDFLYQCLPYQVKERVTASEVEASKAERTKIWKTSLPIIVHQPMGVGLGRRDLFEAALRHRAYLQGKFFLLPELQSRMGFESTYLDILYSLGIMGLLAFCWMLYVFFSTGIHLLCNQLEPASRHYIAFISSAMVVWLIGAATSERCYDVHSMVLFVLIIVFHNTIVLDSRAKLSIRLQ